MEGSKRLDPRNLFISNRYRGDSAFVLYFRILPSLAFILQEDVIELFDIQYFLNDKKLFIPALNDYFESSQIRRLPRGHCKEPKLSVEFF